MICLLIAGIFDTKREAAEAYDKATRDAHGRFAKSDLKQTITMIFFPGRN
jgi:hypothetical protein